LIQGGLHPELGIGYYVDLLKTIKEDSIFMFTVSHRQRFVIWLIRQVFQ